MKRGNFSARRSLVFRISDAGVFYDIPMFMGMALTPNQSIFPKFSQEKKCAKIIFLANRISQSTTQKNPDMNYQIHIHRRYKMAFAQMMAALGFLLMTANIFAQTTNAYDTASDPAYSGDGPANGLGSAAGPLNGGFGFGAWIFTVNGTGGAFIQNNGPSGNSFDLWNTSANNSTVAVRPFSSPLVAGQSFSFQFQLNSLDNTYNTNAIILQDASGNTLFSYWHVGGDNNNGHYTDASTVNGSAVNFQYRYQQFSTYTFTLNSPTTYTFTDNSTGATLSGTISGSIAQFAFFRGNGGPNAPGNGQDFQFDILQVVSAAPPNFISQTPPAGSYGGSRTNVSVQVVAGGAAINTGSIVMKLDGNTVAPSITTTQGVTTITYSPNPSLTPGSLHSAQITLADSNNNLFTNNWTFTTGFPSLPAVLPGPMVVSNNEVGLVLFSAAGDDWIGSNYGANSGKTIYARFSVNFDNLNGETGNGGGYGGLQFILGGINGAQHVIVGNAWASTNWSIDPSPAPQADLNPVTPVVFNTWHTIVERVDYTPGGNATVNTWLDPDFTQTEAAQPNGPLTVSTVDTFDTIALRTGNGTTSATFSNIVIAATSAGAGFAAPAAPQFLNLVPAANDSAAAVASPISAQVYFGTYGISTNNVVLTLDGTQVTPTYVVTANSIVVNYQPSTPFVTNSAHTVVLSVTDSNNATYSTSWSFTADPYPTLPVTIPGPIDVIYGVNGDLGVQLFTSENEWIGNNYQSTSTNTLYAQFSMTFFDLNGKTGVGGAYGGLHFYEGLNERLLVGDAWISTNWSCDAKEAGEPDLNPVTPIVLNEWHTMVVKSVYSSGNPTAVTVWLDPDFTKPELGQINAPITASMDNTFDNVRLRCGQGSAAAEYTNIVFTATSPFAAALPVLSIKKVSGAVTLSWTGSGTLQTATTLMGPWTVCANQGNPQIITTTNAASFYRLH